MNRTRQARMTLAWVTGAAVLLAMAPVIVVWWIEGDGAGEHAAVGVLSPRDAAAHGAPGDDVASSRERPSAQQLQSPARPALAPQADAYGSRVEEQGFFAGVPRAWLVPLAIVGRVVDERGAPVAGAIIRLVPDDATAGVVRQAVGSTPSERPSTVSDADGGFTLETWRGLPGAGMLPLAVGQGTPAVSITGPTSATLLVSCPGGRSPVADVGTQVLRAGAVLTGRVVDGAGRPLPGLRVQFTSNPEPVAAPAWVNWTWVTPVTDLESTVTDAAGNYSFDHLGPGRGSVLLAEPGWRQSVVTLEPWIEGASVLAPDLIADEGAVLRGVVLDAQGQPLPGIAVHAVDDDWWADSALIRTSRFETLESGDQRWRAVSGTDGGFAIPGLDRRATAVIAGADGRAPVVVSGAWPGGRVVEVRFEGGPDEGGAAGDEAGDDAETDATFALHVVDTRGASLDAAAVLAGTVVGSANGFAQVSAERVAPGRFAVRRPGAEGVVLLVSAPQHASRRVELGGADVSDAAPIAVALSSEARVDGIVRDDSGAAVPNAWVSALPFGGSYAIAGIVPTVTDAEGRFTLEGLAAGNWPLDVKADGMLPNAEHEVRLAAGELVKDLLITLQRFGNIAGRVHYADGGSPRMDADSGSGRLEVSRTDELGAATSWRTDSFDKDGFFVVRGLRPGDYEIRTFEDEAAVPIVAVSAGQTTEVDVVVPRPPVVRGQVLAGDVPIAGALIQYTFPRSAASEDWQVILDGARALDTTRSDSEGRFLLTIADAGSIEVWASTSGGGASATVPLTVAKDQEAAVVLRLGAGRLQGSVVEAIGGAPVRGAEVRARGSFVAADADGRFELSHLQPGEYTLHAEAPGHLPAASAPLVLAGDETLSDLRLELVRAASVKVTVLGPDGFPVDGAQTVLAWRVDGAVLDAEASTSKSLRTEAGTATLDTLPAGNYWVGLPTPGALQSMPNTPLDARIDNRVPVTLVPGQLQAVTLHVVDGAAR